MNPKQLFELYFSEKAFDLQSIGRKKVKKKSYRTTFLENRTAEEQFALDVAMWYGTLTYQDPDKLTVLIRMFTLLYWGGLFYKRNERWRAWAGTDMPLCASLSHRGRVMIQLPRRQPHETGNEFMEWLTAGINTSKFKKRFGATHGIDYLNLVERVPLGYGRYKRLQETKKSLPSGEHWGMNIAVGGLGQTNPFSLNRIDDFGKHGHVYIHYLPPTPDAYGGVLFACEPSAPYDMWQNKGWHVPLRVPDQGGGHHGIGGGQTYQMMGGMNWQDSTWEHIGPNDKKNLDNKIIDLTDTGWKFIKDKPEFHKNWLNQPGKYAYEQPLVSDVKPPSIFTSSYLTAHNLTLAVRTMDKLQSRNISLEKILNFQVDLSIFTQELYLKGNAFPMKFVDWEKASSVKKTKTLTGRGRIVPVDNALKMSIRQTLTSQGKCKTEGPTPTVQHIKERLNSLVTLWEKMKTYWGQVKFGKSSGRLTALGGLAILIDVEYNTLYAALSAYEEHKRQQLLNRPLPPIPPRKNKQKRKAGYFDPKDIFK